VVYMGIRMIKDDGMDIMKSHRLYLVVMTLIAVIMTIANVVIFSLFIFDRGRYQEASGDSSGVLTGSEQKKDEDNEYVKDSDGRTAAELKQEIKKSMEEGKGTISLLRELFPENVVVYQSNKYLFLPIYDKLVKNDIRQENIKVLADGEIQYQENGKTVSEKGIDVSRYQGEIDWEKVAADGVKFAFIRVGFRGYGTGAIVLDENFEANIKGATAAGIKVGVYFFSQAINTKEAVEEAEFVLEHIKGYRLDYPIVFDTEDIVNEDSRTEGLTPEELTDITIAFCEAIKEAGHTPMIYANLRWFTMSLDMTKLEKYEKWYAYYDSQMYFPYKISIWQYTESGQVDGINGNVDLNISIHGGKDENE